MKVLLLISFWSVLLILLEKLQPNIYPIDLIALFSVMGISYFALSRHNNSRRSNTQWGVISRVISQLAINLFVILTLIAMSEVLSPKKVDDEYGGLALIVFYAIYFYSFRLNNIDNAAALRHNKEKEKKERDIKERDIEEEQNKLERQKNKLQRKKNLQLENIRIEKSIELLELKLERVTNKKNAINNQITSLEEKIRSEKLSFDTLKGKYPFLSKATIVHNR
jgi:hypothetical protein